MSNSLQFKFQLFIAGLLCLFFFEAQAKIAPVTLSELIKKSQTIVYGHAEGTGDSVQGKDIAVVPFSVLKVLKGAASLKSQQISLCISPPPMVDYPDVSKLTGDNLLFLIERPSGCFELSRGYKSMVLVRDNRALTKNLEHQPPDQSLKLLFQKIDYLLLRSQGGVDR